MKLGKVIMEMKEAKEEIMFILYSMMLHEKTREVILNALKSN